MKKSILASITTAMIIFLTSCGCCKKAVGNSNVSFYKVPLVCSAAPHIGCGSKSKPVLLGLEQKKEVVSEAWLNREGTVIAVVWKENTTTEQRTKVADTIFKENKMEVSLILGKEEKKLKKEFGDKQSWYRTNDVDKLSTEEAGIIADRMINRVNAKTPLSKEQIDSLKAGMIQMFSNRFTKNYGSAINNNEQKVWEENRKTTEDEILAVGKKYLTEEQQAELKNAVALGLRPTEGEVQNTKGCCSPKQTDKNCDNKKAENKGCCSKPNK